MVKSSSIQQSDRKLINCLGDAHTKIVRPVKSFSLKSNMEFASRSLTVFNKLNTLEMNHKTWLSEHETLDSFDPGHNVCPPVSSDVFKKPLAPISRKFKNSRFTRQRNMRKWIKYSLEDVEISSDAKNAAVAFQFLDDLRKKKEKEVNEEESSDDRIVFRKPQKKSLKRNFVDSSSSIHDEVRVGCPQSEKACPNKRSKSVNTIQLSHLQDTL